MASKELNAAVKKMRRQWTEKLPRELRGRLWKAVNTGANEVADMQRRLAPVDSGDLKDSIKVVRPGDNWKPDNPNVRGVTIGATAKGSVSAAVVAGDAKAWYARLVEHGTRRSRAAPYFFPAWRALKRRVTGRVSRAFRAAVKEVGGE